MDVGVLEPGQEQPPAEVDDAGRRADRRCDVVRAPDGRDPVPVDRDRIGPGSPGVDGMDVAPGEDDVGGSFWHDGHDGTRRSPAAGRPTARNGPRRLRDMATVHLLHAGYIRENGTRVGSSISFVRDGDALIVV